MTKSFAALLALLISIPLVALAGVPKTAVFVAAEPQAKNKKIIKKGIEKAIDDMSFLTRPIARGRLEDSNIAMKTISVAHKGSSVVIQHDKRKAVESPASGASITWKREDGEKFKVSQEVKDNEIVQVFRAPDGAKTLTYKFAPDGKSMKVAVYLKSPKLGAPLRYTLQYKLQ